ncbi:PREDICTED: uncharacterized protein LOC109241742 [Nicotiana attenuata]|uniref:uncharacterized protein LOC109241742 n=1 Tax=Nicotiana attenuata TaxID=49451 RepID=UPI000904FF75|nr:PREDICTED: uncharacterized protein LOC109241742 [Nicotiana attenuata]
MTDQAVTCMVSHNRLQMGFMMTIVYAFNTKEERRSLWNYLDTVSKNVGGPWIVMGDFNSVLHTDDKVGGNPVSLAEIVDFQQCIEQCELLELPTSGSRYTWNDRHGDNRILSKIEWVFINTAWLNLMPAYMACYLEEGISDHCPLKLSNVNSPRRAKAAFKFCNVWASHPNFIDIVNEGWKQEVEGCSMFKVVRKLKMMKKELRMLNKNYFSNIIEEADADRMALSVAQAELHKNPLDVELQKEEHQKFQKFKRSSYLAEVYLQQRSKVTWIKLGDDNNRYFFLVIKHRRLQEAIIQLTNKTGDMKTEQEEIAGIFVEYYQELLGTKGRFRDYAIQSFLKNGKILSITQQLQLVRSYTGPEVKKAMFSINDTKSPGPNGYRSGFYKAAWSVIGEDVTKAVLEFLENGELLSQINSTSIALIPKVKNPLQSSQFRPIACCNVIYKCISKIICTRLRKAIPMIVADNQAAFIEGRSLIHNMLICHDLLRHYNRKTTPRCLMKIDLRKHMTWLGGNFWRKSLEVMVFQCHFSN